MYSYFRIFSFLFAAFFANGCILLTNGDFSGIRDRFSESESFPYKRLSLRILYIPEKNDIIFNLSEEEQQEREQEWKKILSSAYRNSGLFEEVVLDEPGDIEMRIKIVEVEAEDRNFSYLISKGYGFAPYREEGSFLMSSDFYDSEGVHLGSVDLSEKYEYYYQVLFVFLMPFYYPSGEYEKLVENMGLKTLQQALSKGYLKIGSSKK